MRIDILDPGAKELNYEIRQIVDIAQSISSISNSPITWENIGDPVQKGEKISPWMKEIVSQTTLKDSSYAYSPTRGLLNTREFLAKKNNALGGAQIDPDDIIFFNGLGDAVSTIYNLLKKEARVIGPSPAYPTHSSAEAKHANSSPITYNLNPYKTWQPDTKDLYYKVKYNPNIVGMMIINPDNPTGAVFSTKVVREMIAIAKEFNMFLIVDEIYLNMVFKSTKNYKPITTLIGDVPAISLKGISKDMPWPGGRCGWMEVYNKEKDENFSNYIDSILRAKQLEVCSTTLPQAVIPQIFTHPEYRKSIKKRNDFFESRSKLIHKILSKNPYIYFNPTQGAFYMSIIFNTKLYSSMKHKTLPVKNNEVRNYLNSIRERNPALSGDTLFVYELLASQHICLVPLSSFVTNLYGFRCTLLEQDDEKFIDIYTRINDSILQFFN